MKTETGLTIIHRQVKNAIRVEVYTDEQLEKQYHLTWWQRVKRKFNLKTIKL